MQSLNDKLWNGIKLQPEIKEKLLFIARRIVSDLKINVKVKHVLFTGSLASFVWRSSSDIDLHIIVDPVGSYEDVATEYLNMYSKLFNSHHSIFIRGYLLELNIKMEEKLLDNKGVYDILTDTWIQEPSMPSNIVSGSDKIKDIVLDYQDRIDELISLNLSLDEGTILRREIKEMRTRGLADSGEYSIGNLVFKELRHSGYLGKLYDTLREKEDRFLSFENFGEFFNRIL